MTQDPQLEVLINLLNDPRYVALFVCLALWALLWQGCALWRAAHNHQMRWFVVLLVLNTFGILEIVYLFYFQKKKTNSSENTPEIPKK